MCAFAACAKVWPYQSKHLVVPSVTLFMYLGDVQVVDISARNERLFNQFRSMQVTCVGSNKVVRVAWLTVQI